MSTRAVLALALAVLAALVYWHVPFGHVAAAALFAELAVCAVLGIPIVRALRRRPVLYFTTATGSKADPAPGLS